jgi:putative copper export protein
LITAPDAIVIGLRALSFIALFQATGSALFLWLFKRQLQVSGPGLARIAKVAAMGAIAFTLAHHVLSPARMTGSFSDVFDLSLQAFLIDSSAGSARALRLAGLVLLIAGLRETRGYGRHLTVLGTGAALGSFALMGHTTTHDPRLLLTGLLLVHIVIVAFWFGSLLPLIHVTESEDRTTGNAVLSRFSALATWSVPLILVAGAAIWYTLLPGFAAIMTPYSKMLMAKVAGFTVLLGLAALNKWRYVPRLCAGDAEALVPLRRSIAREWSLMALVLILTATLTGLFSPD